MRTPENCPSAKCPNEPTHEVKTIHKQWQMCDAHTLRCMRDYIHAPSKLLMVTVKKL